MGRVHDGRFGAREKFLYFASPQLTQLIGTFYHASFFVAAGVPAPISGYLRSSAARPVSVRLSVAIERQEDDGSPPNSMMAATIRLIAMYLR